MSDKTIDQTHVEEEKISDVMNNLTNAVTSDATNPTNSTTKKYKLSEKIMVALVPQKFLLTYQAKIYVIL